jgi:hypothetical protein
MGRVIALTINTVLGVIFVFGCWYVVTVYYTDPTLQASGRRPVPPARFSLQASPYLNVSLSCHSPCVVVRHICVTQESGELRLSIYG